MNGERRRVKIEHQMGVVFSLSQAQHWALEFQMEKPDGFYITATLFASCICGIKENHDVIRFCRSW